MIYWQICNRSYPGQSYIGNTEGKRYLVCVKGEGSHLRYYLATWESGRFVGGLGAMGKDFDESDTIIAWAAIVEPRNLWF